MSKLLVNEHPLIVLPTLAAKIGLKKAIMLQQIHFWITLPKAIEKEGRKWHYDTHASWLIQFPFWSLKTIKRLTISLREDKLIIAKAFNAYKHDQTLWYTIDYDELLKIELAQTLCTIDE